MKLNVLLFGVAKEIVGNNPTGIGYERTGYG